MKKRKNGRKEERKKTKASKHVGRKINENIEMKKGKKRTARSQGI